MAEQARIAAPFPGPPPFHRHFTKRNLALLRHARREIAADGNPGHDDGVNVAPLPAELCYLIPPALPSDSRYSSFGVDIDLNTPDPDLAVAKIRQLYLSHVSIRQNPQPHLLALARSSLTTFLALIGVLSQDPELYLARVENVQAIMYNMHHLINQYRPHQARETLILMMQERVDKVRKEIGAIDAARDKVVRILQSLQRNSVEQPPFQNEATRDRDADRADKTNTARRTRQKLAWLALQSELGKAGAPLREVG